jgi:hypothetical protein
MRSMLSVLANVGGILAVTWRSWTVVLLVLGSIALGPAVISFQATSDGQDALSRLILFEPPLPARIAPVHHLLEPWGSTSTSTSGLSAFFPIETEGRSGQTLSTRTLYDIYRFVIPLVMILVGANLLPHERRVYASLFSLPGGRLVQYLLHLTSLICLVTSILVLIFVANLAAVSCWHGLTTAAESVPLLVNYHLTLLLYAFIYTALGFVAAILFRKRSTGIIAAIVLFVLLIAVAPQAYLAANQNYVRNHSDEVQAAGTYEVLLDDPLFVAIRSLTYLPGDAVSRALAYLPEIRNTDDDETHASSMSTAEKRLAVRQACASMGWFSLGTVVLGGIVFLRKEVHEG